HTFPADLDILLVSPQGQAVMLMSDAGGNESISNVKLTFDDDAGLSLPSSLSIFTGTYRPTDYEPGDTMPAGAPAGPYSNSLSAFKGASPNGTWSLYIADANTNLNAARLMGWGLHLITSARS